MLEIVVITKVKDQSLQVKAGLRKVLYMAAVASLRFNLRLKGFYDRLIPNHKPPKVALVAVMRKLLKFMNAVLNNNSFWVNDYV